MGKMVTPSDQEARKRFATELDHNFSVVASAGSGKTSAIIERVLSVARSTNAAENLPRLVVVTYANRAADEMQQRARQRILDEHRSPAVQTAFNRAFFGTIHSFCMKLLADHGHYLGLPTPLELLADDDDLWHEFVQGRTAIGHSLDPENRRALLRLVQARDLMELARRSRTETLSASPLLPCPSFDFNAVYAQTDRRDSDTVSKSQADLRDWEKRYAGDWEFLRWPMCFSTAGSKFTEVWQEAFAPLRKWICNLAACVAAEIQKDYLEFRLERGLVTYDDQVALAKELLQHPIAGPRIREQGFRVILDEAQDTAPAQFDVLLETSRPVEATGSWPNETSHPPRAGHFCMVGDFQQSIYRKHSELKYYRRIHGALVATDAGEELEFSVTFRLDEKQLEFVNATFREILNNQSDSVRFVDLQARPGILPGKVIRIHLSQGLLQETDKKDYQKARREAEYLARWLKNAGPEDLAADSWRDVAILCPRKAWLQTIAAALRREGLPVALQSERDVNGDSPAYAWLTALLTIMTDPRNAYEIVGVLREIFGISDHDFAVFSESDGSRFWIDEGNAVAGKVGSPLQLLAGIRGQLDGLSLFDAVARVVEQTQLRERLLLLPAAEFGDLGRELDVLLAQAAEAEADALSLWEFAERLRNDFTTERTVRFAADDNAIQLITSYKAKGSEWQAVIVPYLGRDLRMPSPRYPDLVKSPETGELLIALSAAEKSKELKKALETAHHQEIERLLYVATTRARHTLTLVLDHEIFATSQGQLQKGAQLRRLLRGADIYRGEFDERTSAIEQKVETKERKQAAPSGNAPQIERVSSRELSRAAARAAAITIRVAPSGFDVAPIEYRTPRSQLESPATLYGHWWHRFFQSMDWKAGPDAAQKLFAAQLTAAPDPGTAAKDWAGIRDNLFRATPLALYLDAPSAAFHGEFSFGWRLNERAAVEGFIDLLVVDHEAERCLLLDWKTNRIKPDGAAKLRDRYRPQIAAYWKAVREITKYEVQAGIFATATGQFCEYGADELEAEWERLRSLPPENLRGQILEDELSLP
jgi:ATP-dependent exoDNAse (exonuclease V) beta subunit